MFLSDVTLGAEESKGTGYGTTNNALVPDPLVLVDVGCVTETGKETDVDWV